MKRRVDLPWTGVVLCAGLGTRLRPLTHFFPKPLVPIADTPLAQFAAAALVRAGARALRVNAFHLAPQVEAFARQLAKAFAIDVCCHTETQLQGTGGGLAAMNLGDRTVVSWNGDIFAPSLSLEWLNDEPLEAPTLVVAKVRASESKTSTGTLGLDPEGNVVRVRGESFGNEIEGVDYVGVAALPATFTRTLSAPGCLMADGLLPWLRAGKPVRTHVFEGYWSDGGTLDEYARQNLYWLQRNGRDVYVGQGAVCLPGVELRRSVVGKNARVSGSGVLERVIVLPGAPVTAPLCDGVVLPDGQVLPVNYGESTLKEGNPRER